MSDDLIKRSDAISEIRKARTPDIASHQYAEQFINAVCRAPSADRPSGKWIDKGWHGDWQFETDGRGNCWREFRCSNCNTSSKVQTNFCPYCGARMEGE